MVELLGIDEIGRKCKCKEATGYIWDQEYDRSVCVLWVGGQIVGLSGNEMHLRSSNWLV